MLSQVPVTGPSLLGVSRVMQGVAVSLRRLGHEVTLIGPEELGLPSDASWGDLRVLAEAARAFVRARGGDHDVVDFNEDLLPFPRSDFPRSTLLVARTALLAQWLDELRPPRRHTLRTIAADVRYFRKVRARQRTLVGEAFAGLRSADRINVPNEHDRDLLVRRGLPAQKIFVLPYALAEERAAQLGMASRPRPPASPAIAFVGTFDWRKGAVHFAPVFERVVREVPLARLRLLGCKGMIVREAAVRAFFPRSLRSRIDIAMTFDPATLPARLAECSVGLYPSYYEGFPLGVLEMLSAHLPVVAFDAPGAPMMLPPEWLARVGDEAGLASRLVALLRDPEGLERSRARAREISGRFHWDAIARDTAAAYSRALSVLRGEG